MSYKSGLVLFSLAAVSCSPSSTVSVDKKLSTFAEKCGLPDAKFSVDSSDSKRYWINESLSSGLGVPLDEERRARAAMKAAPCIREWAKPLELRVELPVTMVM